MNKVETKTEMNTHLQNLLGVIPDLKNRRVLDVGAGRGKFLLGLAEAGISATGIEYSDKNVETALAEAEKMGLDISVSVGSAEALSFEDASFDFLNLAEVIEHVESPNKVLQEISRVLSTGGLAYVSVPSRYSWLDTHFNLPLINWLPRSAAHAVIGLLGKHKSYDGNSGKQKITEMFYTTYGSFLKKAGEYGLKAIDIREVKIKNKIKNPILQIPVRILYRLIRPFYFKTFHFLLEK